MADQLVLGLMVWLSPLAFTGLWFFTVTQVRRAWQQPSVTGLTAAALLLALLFFSFSPVVMVLYYTGTLMLAPALLLLAVTLRVHRRAGALLSALFLGLLVIAYLPDILPLTLLGAGLAAGVAMGAANVPDRYPAPAFGLLLTLTGLCAVILAFSYESLAISLLAQLMPGALLGLSIWKGFSFVDKAKTRL